MFQSKSFNLVHEENAKKGIKFYEPKHCRWLKYFVIPALIGFALLLILVNVDFSGDGAATAATTATTESSVVTTLALQTDVVNTQETHAVSKTQFLTELLMSSMQTKALTTTMANNIEQDIQSHNKVFEDSITNAAICNNSPNDLCLVNCSNGDLLDLNSELDSYEQYCEDDMHVILDNCLFTSGQMHMSFFPSSYYWYHLRILEVIKGNLVSISDGAFQSSATINMQELSINSTALSKLTERTFNGLQYLKVLKWLNLPSATKFEGTKFLQPVADTIKEVMLCQLSKNDVYDPFSWLNGTKSFPLLTRVDLSNNNFGDTLNEKTFGNLVAVRELILANSSITNIAKDTFKNLLDTLEYLDLSLNRLHTLDVSALATKTTLRLELHGNDWDCICENEELMVAVRTKQFSYTVEPRCVAPAKWANTPISEVILNCGAEPAPTTSKPTTPPVTAEPTAITEPPDSPTPPDTAEPPVTQEPPDSPKPPDTTEPSLTPEPPKSPKPPVTEKPPPITQPPITPPITPPTSAGTSESNETATNGNSPTPPTPTPPPITYAQLQCQRYAPANSYYNISIRHLDARFTINSDTSTSAVLLIKSDMKRHLTLFYFAADNYMASAAERVPSENIITESRSLKVDCRFARAGTSFTLIHVEGLLSNQSYVFCLVPELEPTTSPLNCQAHFLGEQARKHGVAWLLTHDQAWFISSFIFGILLAVGLGLLTIYWLLRWRPTWLRGCKRIIRAAATSYEVFLLPKQQKHAAAEDSTYNMSTCESYDYMQFYKDTQDAKLRLRPNSVQASLVPSEHAPAVPQTSEYYMQFYRDQKAAVLSSRPATMRVNTIPEEPAPAVPEEQRRSTHLESTLSANVLKEQYLDLEEDDGNIYQSIAYYELLF